MMNYLKLAVLKELGLNWEQITKKNRRRELVWARRIIAAILRDRGWTLSEIGEKLNFDHSTIIYHLREHRGGMEYDPEYQRRFGNVNRTFVEYNDNAIILDDIRKHYIS